eukprot:1156484-Pelagomonas_calceolata.AAC.7
MYTCKPGGNPGGAHAGPADAACFDTVFLSALGRSLPFPRVVFMCSTSVVVLLSCPVPSCSHPHQRRRCCQQAAPQPCAVQLSVLSNT